MLLQQVRAAALWTSLRHRLIGRGEIALGIIRAAIKRVAPAARLLLHQLAIGALRALYADKVLLDVLAFGIAAAGNKFPVAPVPQHHVAPAFRTNLFQWDIGHALALVQPPRGPAIGDRKSVV